MSAAQKTDGDVKTEATEPSVKIDANETAATPIAAASLLEASTFGTNAPAPLVISTESAETTDYSVPVAGGKRPADETICIETKQERGLDDSNSSNKKLKTEEAYVPESVLEQGGSGTAPPSQSAKISANPTAEEELGEILHHYPAPRFGCKQNLCPSVPPSLPTSLPPSLKPLVYLHMTHFSISPATEWEPLLRELVSSGKVSKGELDDGAVMQLRQVPSHIAMACLKHLQTADLSSVRSKSAYLVGIIRRLNTDTMNVAKGGTDGKVDIDSTISAMPAGVRRKLDQIFSAGAVAKKDIEPRVLRELKEFGEHGACTILERYASKNLQNVRNKTAFLIGVIKRYRDEVRESGSALAAAPSAPTITITGAVPGMGMSGMLGNMMGGMLPGMGMGASMDGMGGMSGGGGIGSGNGGTSQNPLMNVLRPEQQEMVKGMIMSNIMGGGTAGNVGMTGPSGVPPGANLGVALPRSNAAPPLDSSYGYSGSERSVSRSISALGMSQDTRMPPMDMPSSYSYRGGGIGLHGSRSLDGRYMPPPMPRQQMQHQPHQPPPPRNGYGYVNHPAPDRYAHQYAPSEHPASSYSSPYGSGATLQPTSYHHETAGEDASYGSTRIQYGGAQYPWFPPGY